MNSLNNALETLLKSVEQASSIPLKCTSSTIRGWGWGKNHSGWSGRGMVLRGMGLTPPDRITDKCENITFPQLRWRVVKMMKK